MSYIDTLSPEQPNICRAIFQDDPECRVTVEGPIKSATVVLNLTLSTELEPTNEFNKVSAFLTPIAAECGLLTGDTRFADIVRRLSIDTPWMDTTRPVSPPVWVGPERESNARYCMRILWEHQSVIFRPHSALQ